MSKPKLIAFYLPQYHPTPDNDRWWGKGFTEWTNVGKAKPLFRGHYQPKVPADLGYYDLRLSEVREQQAELAREAGIYGFCYYHYWFGNGKEELELPFNEVLRLGKPDFPFMLCWANESWHKKFWDKDGKGSSKEMLIEQTYPGEQDIIDHFYRLLPAFKDSRYIKMDGRPMFMIYQPDDIPNLDSLMKIWKNLSEKEGIANIFFIAHMQSKMDSVYEKYKVNLLKSMGFDAITVVRISRVLSSRSRIRAAFDFGIRKIFRFPICVSYKKAIGYLTNSNDSIEYLYPTVVPNWDHTPRSGLNGLVYTKSSPGIFEEYLSKVIDTVSTKHSNFNFIFIKSWNEWGEGNYIEPDMKYGHSYLNIIHKLMYDE